MLGYARTKEGFVTSLHDLAPRAGVDHHVSVFNPGSNYNQVSSLRLVNPGDTPAEVTITGIDDAGEQSGEASLIVPAGASAAYTAAELESGSASGLRGGLGDGTGKWRLRVTARQPIHALSLMSTPTGHVTNLSTSSVAADSAHGGAGGGRGGSVGDRRDGRAERVIAGQRRG